jgi:hypothetical protein
MGPGGVAEKVELRRCGLWCCGRGPASVKTLGDVGRPSGVCVVCCML